jgi:hypothetical protein
VAAPECGGLEIPRKERKLITFPSHGDQPTTWKLGTKLADEKYSCLPKKLVMDNRGPSVAWVPFVCQQTALRPSGPEYMMKIFMQCVYYLPPVVCSLTINGRC